MRRLRRTMLSREEFKTCLEEANFSKEQVENIFQKNIDKILNKRTVKDITDILQALDA